MVYQVVGIQMPKFYVFFIGGLIYESNFPFVVELNQFDF